MTDATAPPGAGKYEELAGMIEEIERDAPRREVGTIDITQTFVHGDGTRTSSYAELESIIEEIEGGRRVARQAAAQRDETSMPRAQQPESQQAPPAEREIQQPQQEQPGAARKEVAGKELGSVAKRLGSLMPSMKPMGRRRVNVKDIVLPSLSTSDQISELERIIEGVKEGVFDKDHIEIVLQEVYGLDQVVADEKKANRRKKSQLNELDQSLVDMRDLRLAEAVSLIDKIGA